MRRRGVLSYGAIGATGVVLVLVGFVVVGVTVGSATRLAESQPTRVGSQTARERPGNNVSELRAALAASLTFVPASGATSVAPDAPIVVKAGAGHLAAVRVTSSSGVAVAGGLTWSADKWQSSGSLAYGAVYHVTASVSGASRVHAESTVTFRTLTPPASVTASVFPNSGLAVGVGQPVVFRFSRAITGAAARAPLLMHLSVTESRPIIGGWYACAATTQYV